MKGKLKIVGIGNSIVNGFPLKRSQCFLSLIRQETGHEVINKGVNGETTQDIRNRFSADMLFHCPDVGMVLTGTNDFIYQKGSTKEALVNLGWMIKKMEEAGIHPLLLTPIPVEKEMAEKCWMMEAGIDYEEVNQRLYELGEEMMEAFPQYTLDLGKLFQVATEGHAATEYYIDGLHPTEEGHRILADIIKKKLEEY